MYCIPERQDNLARGYRSQPDADCDLSWPWTPRDRLGSQHTMYQALRRKDPSIWCLYGSVSLSILFMAFKELVQTGVSSSVLQVQILY